MNDKEMKELLEVVICELRGMDYDVAHNNENLLKELRDQLNDDLQNINETR